MRSNFQAIALIILISLLSGCTTLWQDMNSFDTRKGTSSSLVDYLYPKGQIPLKHGDIIPDLKLPLRVGLAFVPTSGFSDTPGLSEADKSELLEKVKTQFQEKRYVNEITIIPDTYLRSTRGFDGVEQVARLYGLDVMALVSYDQVVNSNDTKASLLYWTVVGAYVIKGSQNEVQTFVDTAIFDVKSRKLLFRAPGISRVEETSTLINSVEQLRKNRQAGFKNAVDNMVVNLDKELSSFQKRIKKDKSVTVSTKAGYGGGSFGLVSFFLVALLCFSKRAKKDV